jgi:MFS family permease
LTTDHKADSIELKTLSPRPPAKLSTSRKLTNAYESTGSMYHENITGSQLIYQPRFWLLFLTTGLLAAIGQMYIYSVGYMVKALITSHLSTSEIGTQAMEEIIQKEQQLQVSLLSIANCIGRILAGILGDIILQSFNKPRTLLLFIPGFGFMASQILLLVVADYTKLPLVSLLIGLVYGFIFCIIPIIVGDTFGMESFSFNWGIVALAPIVPSFYFTSLFGKVYDSNSTTDPVSNTVGCTLGKLCYSSIFKFTFCVTIIVTVIIVILNFGRRYLNNHATEVKV